MTQCAICPEVRKVGKGIMPDRGPARTQPIPEKLLRKVRRSAHVSSKAIAGLRCAQCMVATVI